MEEGEIVVNSRLFGDIIRKFQGDTIDINLDGTSMNLKCEKSNFHIQCQLPDEYPMLPIVEKIIHLIFHHKNLAIQLKRHLLQFLWTKQEWYLQVF